MSSVCLAVRQCWTYHGFKHCRIERSFRHSVRDKRRYAWIAAAYAVLDDSLISRAFKVHTFLWVGGGGSGDQRFISAVSHVAEIEYQVQDI